jgi:hypothetical protein
VPAVKLTTTVKVAEGAFDETAYIAKLAELTGVSPDAISLSVTKTSSGSGSGRRRLQPAYSSMFAIADSPPASIFAHASFPKLPEVNSRPFLTTAHVDESASRRGLQETLSKPVPDMPMCTMEIMSGAQAPTTMFVVGAAGKGAKAPGPGFFCGEQGCDPMNEGDIATEPGVFTAMMAPGAKFPEEAMGFMGCAMPAGRGCDLVTPGMMAPPGVGMLAGLTDMAGVMAPGKGMFIPFSEGMEFHTVQEMKKGDPSPEGGGLAIAFVEEGTIAPSGIGVYCAVDWTVAL